MNFGGSGNETLAGPSSRQVRISWYRLLIFLLPVLYILVGEPSPTKKGKGALLGDLVKTRYGLPRTMLPELRRRLGLSLTNLHLPGFRLWLTGA